MLDIKLSEKIELIVNILDEIKKENAWYQQSFKDAEMDETNLAHEMIGIKQGQPRQSPPKNKERNPIGTKWQNALLKREVAKSHMRINKSLIDFLNSEDGKRIHNKLKNVLQYALFLIHIQVLLPTRFL